MRSERSIDRLNSKYGLFFGCLAAVSLKLAHFHFCLGQREVALLLSVGFLLFGAISFWAILGPILGKGHEDDEGDGRSGLSPVPILPRPDYHPVAPKIWPPLARTLTFQLRLPVQAVPETTQPLNCRIFVSSEHSPTHTTTNQWDSHQALPVSQRDCREPVVSSGLEFQQESRGGALAYWVGD